MSLAQIQRRLLRRRLMPRAIVACMSLSLFAPVQANENEIMGFIVDNSISNIGHEFYRFFTERLSDTSRLDFNLVVSERPSARWGSLVWVEYERGIVYRRFLPPNTAELKSTAYEAADFVKEEITRRKIENLLQDTIDLDKDEL